MGRNEVDRYLDVIEDSFSAAAAAEEAIAADDLALSFLQDLDLAAALRRVGPLECSLPGGGFRPVVELGNDYAVMAAGSPTILRLSGARYRASSEVRPLQIVDRSLVGLLRTLVRQRVQASVSFRDIAIQGTLTRAGRDHLGLRTTGGEELIPLAHLTSVALHKEYVWSF